MKSLIFITSLFLCLSTNSYMGKFLELTAGGKKSLPNCDSEKIHEAKHDKDYSDSYWVQQLDKAIEQNNYCRQARLWTHFYLVMPKYFMKNDGNRKAVEALYKGSFFLELQWKIKHFKKDQTIVRSKEYWKEIDYYQVSSYWPHLQKEADKAKSKNTCLATLGYYENSQNKERFTLLEEAFLSINSFNKNYPHHEYQKELTEKHNWLKNLNGNHLLCETKSSLVHMEKSKGKKITPQNYWAIYKRLAQIIANYQKSDAIEESLYLMASIINKIDQKVSEGKLEYHDSFKYLYEEDWNNKLNQIINILETEFPNSQWTQKAKAL